MEMERLEEGLLDDGNTREEGPNEEDHHQEEVHHSCTTAAPEQEIWKPEDFKKRECNTFITDYSREVSVHPDSSGYTGFSFTEGDEDGIFFIDSIEPGSPAALTGQLSEGDQIISVNGSDLIHATYEQAGATLDTAGQTVTMIVMTTHHDDAIVRDGRCQCGRPRDRHPPDNKTAEDTVWTTEQHSSEQPTDAHGELGFEGERYFKKFLRLSSDTEPSHVYDLMTRESRDDDDGGGGWSLDGRPPPLVVSVEGGSAEVKPWVQEVIREGLVKALNKLRYTGGFPWILTEGFDEGVGRCVGEAVREVNRDYDGVPVFGISPWGVVDNQHQLVNQGGDVQYSVENKTSDSCCLEKHHTGFLLVDDGREGHRGGEKNFKVKLFEEHIPTQHIYDTSITIPVLCVLASGESSMLERVCASLENNTPWLVMAGSGGMAELLSDISTASDGRDAARVLEKHFPGYSDAQKDQYAIICSKKKLITIYHEEKERPEDFDTAIIKALMPASKLCASGKTFPYSRELILAWRWKRVDFARSQLFKHDIEINQKFVDLIVNILTVGRLEKLYRGVKKDTLIYKLLMGNLNERMGNSSKPDPSVLLEEEGCLLELSRQVSGVMKKLMGEEKPFYFPVLGLKELTSGKRALELFSPRHVKELGLNGGYRNKTCESPWFDLFIWAVLENHSDWAVFFWEMTEEPVLNALSACKMLKEMSKMAYETETKRSMEELSLKFENLANDAMGPCYQNSEDNSLELLNRVSPVWGTNCLQMAMDAESRLFFNHDGLESLLSQVWWGDMKKDTPVWKFLLTFFCPLLLCTNLITFNDKDDSRWKKFWSAPITTFVGNAVMYILFLFLFAYVLLVDFKPAPPSVPSISECVLYFWVFTFLCEEIRQTFSVKLYWQDLWNLCDIFAIIMFTIGLICRMFEPSYASGRDVLCIDFMVFTIRLIHISTIHKEMGPKIIIVGKMMKDVISFLFFLGVWLMAYGVANQALLYPYDPYPYRILRRVLYRPYLYIFGEMKLEEIDVGQAWNISCTTNMTLVDGVTEPCRSEFNNWLVIILLMVFLMVTNILLINLLIAILSNTFNKVEEKSALYWRFQHSNLVQEYQSLPGLAPPLIIINHLHLLFSYLKEKFHTKPPSTPTSDQTVVRAKAVKKWETKQKQKFLEAQSERVRSGDSERMKKMSVKVDNIDQMFQQISYKVDRMEKQQQNQRTEMRALESKMEKCISDALGQILDRLNKPVST